MTRFFTLLSVGSVLYVGVLAGPGVATGRTLSESGAANCIHDGASPSIHCYYLGNPYGTCPQIFQTENTYGGLHHWRTTVTAGDYCSGCQVTTPVLVMDQSCTPSY